MEETCKGAAVENGLEDLARSKMMIKSMCQSGVHRIFLFLWQIFITISAKEIEAVFYIHNQHTRSL